MRVYHFKHSEILVNEAAFNEERFIEQYNEFFGHLLRASVISKMRVYQVINLANFTISSKPFLTEPLLRKHDLPAFKFLTCNN
jgi:hypothetical protein